MFQINGVKLTPVCDISVGEMCGVVVFVLGMTEYRNIVSVWEARDNNGISSWAVQIGCAEARTIPYDIDDMPLVADDNDYTHIFFSVLKVAVENGFVCINSNELPHFCNTSDYDHMYPSK